MKIYNVIVVYDVYCVAQTPEAAREAVLQMIRGSDEPLEASTSAEPEVTEQKQIRAAWENERPIVGADVSDADFAKLKGKTVTETFAMLHTKPRKADAK